VLRITILLSEVATAKVGPSISSITEGIVKETRKEARKLSQTEEQSFAEMQRNPYITK
jgi:hypothetical protein